MHNTDYIHRSFRLLVAILLDSVSILFCRTVLFEELLILTVTPCIGVHCSNFHES